MRFEFIGKVEVENKTRKTIKRTILTIGIVCFLFAIVVNFLYGNKYILCLVIPLIYLISLKRKMKKTTVAISVPMSITIGEDNVEIVFDNTIRNKTGCYSEKYIFMSDAVEKCNYLTKCRELQILVDCQYYVVDGSYEKQGKTRMRKIRFILAKDVEEELMEELKKLIAIDCID